MSRRRAAALAAALLVLHVARATAEPTGPVHLTTSSHVMTEGGSELDLPPGYFLDESQWDALDFEMRRLQDDATRLEAENTSLRSSASSGAPWWAIAAGVAVGAAAGAYAWDRWGP